MRDLKTGRPRQFAREGAERVSVFPDQSAQKPLVTVMVGREAGTYSNADFATNWIY
tara:strand:+ start:2479 stop:2646 length:168 start_codon:yes stop_codon:yes gene_type:complete